MDNCVIQLELTLLMWTSAKRLMKMLLAKKKKKRKKKMLLAKNPRGIWAPKEALHVGTALPRKEFLQSPWTRHEVTSKHVTRSYSLFSDLIILPLYSGDCREYNSMPQ